MSNLSGTTEIRVVALEQAVKAAREAGWTISEVLMVAQAFEYYLNFGVSRDEPQDS